MDNILTFIIGAFKITLLDLALCADNIGIIALATRNLPKKFAQKASAVGILGAIGMRIIFACAMALILAIDWIPIKLLGGLILVKITWDFIKPGQEEEAQNVKTAERFWEAVLIIIVADISMSLDNVLAIAGAANGNVPMIVFGILLNIPIIFWGSRFVSELMNKYKIVIYIGGAVLAHTSFSMILEDNLTLRYLNLPESFNAIFPWMIAAAVFIYGIFVIRHTTSPEVTNEIEVSTTIVDDKENKN